MKSRHLVTGLAAGWLLAFWPAATRAADESNPEEAATLSRMQEQLDQLQRQVADQQKVIEQLQRRLESAPSVEPVPPPRDELPPRAAAPAPFSLGDHILLSGEGAVGFFDTGPEGMWPNSEFRVDEARLFLDVLLGEDLYVFTEINLTQREDGDSTLKLGEMYVELEDVSKLWDKDGQVSLRLGRLNVPFGEEYLVRDAIDNPLISHSLADFWGVDEGVELFGDIGPFDYVIAVQNGSVPTLNDYNSDKAVVARVGLNPAERVRLSLSAMRTGDLAVEGDEMSELWFGNGFIRALGAPETTSTFHAEVFQADASYRWKQGHLKLAAGLMDYDDNDTAADNQRDVYFYSVEALQRCTEKFYGAARLSQIQADDGFPLVGHGEFGEYFFGPLTDDLRRLSLGLGYWLDPRLVLKTEYSFEQREEAGASGEEDERLVAAQAAFKF